MMNKVVLVGELIQNICVSKNNHSNVNSFIVATTRVPKDNKREHEVHFIYCKAFGKAIPRLLDTLVRGQIICVSGQIATAIHTNPDGSKDYRMELWAESVKCMPEKIAVNEKVKNPSDMISQAINLYNRYDYIGEKSVLTLINSNREVNDKPVHTVAEKTITNTVGDTHIEELKAALESNNTDGVNTLSANDTAEDYNSTDDSTDSRVSAKQHKNAKDDKEKVLA